MMTEEPLTYVKLEEQAPLDPPRRPKRPERPDHLPRKASPAPKRRRSARVPREEVQLDGWTWRVAVQGVFCLGILAAALLLKQLPFPMAQQALSGLTVAVEGEPDWDEDLGLLKFVENYFPGEAAVLASSSLNQNIRLSPVTQGTVLRGFGAYTDEQGRSAQSTGQDILVGEGDDLCASADGVVAGRGTHPQWGTTLRVDHQNGYETVYYNLREENLPQVDDRVRAGDVIGAAQGPIVHFELWKDGVPVDPTEYLDP